MVPPGKPIKSRWVALIVARKMDSTHEAYPAFCPNCSKAVSEGAAFCQSCGHNLVIAPFVQPHPANEGSHLARNIGIAAVIVTLVLIVGFFAF